jgi:predicted phosphodiesterase
MVKGFSVPKIRMIGDIHGDWKALFEIASTTDNECIQVGDFGLGFGSDPEDWQMPKNVRFIRGNHDDRKICRNYPQWINDGHVEEGPLGPRMFIGGAWSIDWGRRTPGRDWWDDEELNQREWEDLMPIYVEAKPAVMITHDIPMRIREQVIHNQFNGIGPTRTSFYLQEMLNLHQPKLWFHGHHHTSYVQTLEGCQFVGLGINSYIDVEC